MDLGLISGNEGKWFRKENVPGTLFVAELEGLPESRKQGSFGERREVEEPLE